VFFKNTISEINSNYFFPSAQWEPENCFIWNPWNWSQKRSWKGNEFLPQTLIFIIPISLQPEGVNLLYFKLSLFDLTEFIVWNILGIRHCVAKILGLENQRLWQKLNSFDNYDSVSKYKIWRRFQIKRTAEQLMSPRMGREGRRALAIKILYEIKNLILLCLSFLFLFSI